ncbi:MAG: hypothetical protein ACYDA9_20920 [Terriglobia bacterium]
MGNRRPRTRRKATRSVEENAAGTPSGVAAFSLPNIAELIDHGEITVGVLEPVGCVAVASDEGSTLAMLARQNGETLLQLLTRLDWAIAKAYDEEVFTDEINPPPAHPKLR